MSGFGGSMLSFLSAWKNHETEDVTARARKQIASLSAYGGGESDGAAAATKTSRPLSLLGPELQETEPETESDDTSAVASLRFSTNRRKISTRRASVQLGQTYLLPRDQRSSSFGFTLLNSPASSGIRVVNVVTGTAAEAQGLLANTVITEVNGERVLGKKYAEVLERIEATEGMLRASFLTRTAAIELIKSEAAAAVQSRTARDRRKAIAIRRESQSSDSDSDDASPRPTYGSAVEAIAGATVPMEKPASTTRKGQGPPSTEAPTRRGKKAAVATAPHPEQDMSSEESGDDVGTPTATSATATTATTATVTSSTTTHPHVPLTSAWRFDEKTKPAPASVAAVPELENARTGGTRIKITGSKLYPTLMGVYTELTTRVNEREVYGRASSHGVFYLYYVRSRGSAGQWRISGEIGSPTSKICAFSNARSPTTLQDWYEAVGSKKHNLQQHQPKIDIVVLKKTPPDRRGSCNRNRIRT
eukprot:m.236512 g.236512  ORF g.236512 m.236512 type:complete len:476 (+) comp26183_c2_seq1:140-1567(+)